MSRHAPRQRGGFYMARGWPLKRRKEKPPAGPHPARAALLQVFMEAGAFVHNLAHRQGQRVPYGGVSPV